MTTFPERIRAVQKFAGMTATALSRELGISDAHLSRLKSGENRPSDHLLKAITLRFGVREEWLRDGTEPMLEAAERVPAVRMPDDPRLAELLEYLAATWSGTNPTRITAAWVFFRGFVPGFREWVRDKRGVDSAAHAKQADARAKAVGTEMAQAMADLLTDPKPGKGLKDWRYKDLVAYLKDWWPKAEERERWLLRIMLRDSCDGLDQLVRSRPLPNPMDAAKTDLARLTVQAYLPQDRDLSSLSTAQHETEIYFRLHLVDAVRGLPDLASLDEAIRTGSSKP